MEENKKLFTFCFYLSFLCLSFSQLTFIPVLFSIIFLILKFRNIFTRLHLEDYLFWTFIVLSIISGVLAKNKFTALGGVLILTFYYIFFSIGRSINIDKWWIVNSALISIVTLSVFGIVFYVFPDLSVKLKIGNIYLIEIPSARNFSLGINIIRSSSITPNPVIFSSAVSYLAPFIILYYFHKNRNWLFLALIMLIFTVVIFTSNTRTSILLLSLAFIFMLYILKAKREVIIFLTFVFLILLLAIFLQSSFISRIYSIIEGEDYTSFYNRLDAYKIALSLFSKNFLVGLGLVNFKEYVPYYYGNYVHNTYLSILVEMGILGFLVFLAIITTILVKLLRGFSKNKDHFVFAILLSACTFLLHGFVDNTLYVFALGALFWFLLGVGIKNVQVENF